MRRARNPGANLAPFIMLAGIGGLAYYGYTKGWFSSLLGTTTGTAPVTTTPPATTGGTPAPSFNSLANIYARLSADIAAHEVAGLNALLSLYQWNWYLARSWSGAEPDSSAFANVANFDPSALMSLNAYWSAASTWLAANAGLSGVWSV